MEKFQLSIKKYPVMILREPKPFCDDQTPLIQQRWCGEYIWVINRAAVARKDENRFANCFCPTVQLELFANYQHTYGCFADLDFDGLI